MSTGSVVISLLFSLSDSMFAHSTEIQGLTLLSTGLRLLVCSHSIRLHHLHSIKIIYCGAHKTSKISGWLSSQQLQQFPLKSIAQSILGLKLILHDPSHPTF